MSYILTLEDTMIVAVEGKDPNAPGIRVIALASKSRGSKHLRPAQKLLLQEALYDVTCWPQSPRLETRDWKSNCCSNSLLVVKV